MFYILGVIATSYVLLFAASVLYDWVRPSAIPRFLRNDRKSWALVTGASDGIGFGFCQELAARGFHLILHGRNRQKLERRISDLSKEFPRLQTRIFLADASKPVSFDALLETIEDIHLTVLVNNVGGNDALPRPFMNLQEHSLDDIERTLNLNAGFTAKLTCTLLRILMNNEPSLILNIGSLAALGTPRVSVYAGTKAFLVSHSESLQTELVAQGKDVTVHAVYVGTVQSGGYRPDASLFVPTPRGMAKATLARVGSSTVAITPSLPHAISKGFASNLPRKLKEKAFIAGVRNAEAAFAKRE